MHENIRESILEHLEKYRSLDESIDMQVQRFKIKKLMQT
ncbi:hypothetical protein H310_01633 [Aphanomyces invadans]|uniref:Uncharacterized protein n=1 Tax=Aphanomyces invadans TaxID=157072 RepID=A0A024UU82_9STRA|nr:hypothetical protein H310_01633 [Aphanomyces invadans]ETW09228.1 hypothetical protein H310_01633 [Aphanomyces invadans]|eukprot:XP_008863033.1 hypothetical protein H310_01633 [Aphanomyces invadans]